MQWLCLVGHGSRKARTIAAVGAKLLSCQRVLNTWRIARPVDPPPPEPGSPRPVPPTPRDRPPSHDSGKDARRGFMIRLMLVLLALAASPSTPEGRGWATEAHSLPMRFEWRQEGPVE